MQFYFVGGWPDDIVKISKASNGLKNIHIVGFVSNDQVPTWLASADVLLLPNSGKYKHARVTSPLKLYEYMAAKRPIIATDIPALRGVLSHRENAFLIEPDSAGQMASAVMTVCQNENLSNRIAIQAWKDVQKLTWTNRAQNIFRFFGLEGA